MKKTLQYLFEGNTLSRQQASEALTQIASGEMNNSHIASFLTVFMMRKIQPEELAGFRDALMNLRIAVELSTDKTIDLCGTGGDGKNTFNVSTTASFVVAGAGYKVSKHGNYGVSSPFGSSNLLESLGYEFTNDQQTLRQQLTDYNICFLHAPKFHPAMRHVGPVRKELGLKTFFNMLGPLVNPSLPSHQMTGVFGEQLVDLYDFILSDSTENFSVIYDLGGYDEISLTNNVRIKTRTTDNIYTPEQLGFQTYQPHDIHGGTTQQETTAIFLNILNGKGTQAQQDVVTANAAMAIYTLFPEKGLNTCVEEARQSIKSGAALNVLNEITKK